MSSEEEGLVLGGRSMDTDLGRHFYAESWKHVFWAVNVLAELEVVDFFLVTFVEVLPRDQMEHLLISRHNPQFFQHPSKLVLAHMAVLGLIKVLE